MRMRCNIHLASNTAFAERIPTLLYFKIRLKINKGRGCIDAELGSPETSIEKGGSSDQTYVVWWATAVIVDGLLYMFKSRGGLAL